MQPNTTTNAITSPLPALARALAALVLLLAAPVSTAQPTPVRYVATVSDNAPLRSGDLERFYRVADLPAGTVLRVVEESQDWLRVTYPPGLTAFVRAQDAERRADRVVLTSPRKLRAANLAAGFTGSWKSLLDEPLPEGTELPLIEPVTGPSGATLGYRVAAPEGATGYIGRRLTRQATEGEIDRAVRAAARQTNIPPRPVTPTPATTTPEPEPEPEPEPLAPAEPARQTDDAFAQDPSPADLTPEEPAPAPIAAEPTPEPAQEPEHEPQPPVVIPRAPEPVIPAGETPLAVAADLEARFQQIQRTPILEADVNPLIAAYESAITTLGDSAAEQRLVRRYQQRIELLELRRDYRNRVLGLGAADPIPAAQPETPDAAVESMRRPRPVTPPVPVTSDRAVPVDVRVTVRGRLATSLIYDGDRLPRLYRLVAPDAAPDDNNARTIAYIEPDATAGLASMLGQIVEVEGKTRFAQGGRVRVIDAERVRAVGPR